MKMVKLIINIFDYCFYSLYLFQIKQKGNNVGKSDLIYKSILKPIIKK